MITDTFAELNEQVTQLWDQGQFDKADDLLQEFITSHFPGPESRQAEGLVREGRERQKQYRPDPLRRKLELADGHFRRGEGERAINLLEQILTEKPDHVQALDLIVKTTDMNENMTFEVKEFLQGLPPNDAIQRALASLDRAKTPPIKEDGRKPRASRPTTDADLEERFEEGMREYRGRHHQNAIRIFHEIIARAPEDSRVVRLAKEYSDKAQQRWDEGEVPQDEIPYEATEAASKAKSAMRAGHFSQAVDLLEEAIRLCHTDGVKHSGDWDRMLDDARAYAESEEMEQEGEEILRDKDDWSEVVKLWRKALRANPENDLLKRRLALLQETESNVTKAESFLKVRTGMAPEDQAARVGQLMDDLRLAHTEFPSSKRVEAVLTGLDRRAQSIITQLAEQGSEFLNQARSKTVTTLAEKRGAAERAAATFDLARKLGLEGTQTAVSAVSARLLVTQLKNLEEKLEEAREMIAGGDRLDEAETILALVKEECPQDPALNSELRTLQTRWLDKAKDAMSTSAGLIGMGSAGDYLQRASGNLFSNFGQSTRLLTLRASWETRVLLSRIAGGIVGLGLVFFIGFAGYRGIVVPYLAATPTATLAPTPVPTQRPTASPTVAFTPTTATTSTPVPTMTWTPIPTPTPVGIPGKVTEALVFVYAAPNPAAPKVGFVQRDQSVVMFDQGLGPDGNTLWFHIRWQVGADTVTGWIMSQYVQQAK